MRLHPAMIGPMTTDLKWLSTLCFLIAAACSLPYVITGQHEHLLWTAAVALLFAVIARLINHKKRGIKA